MMHQLVFSTTWLLGAAASGDKEAMAALRTIPPGLIADMSPELVDLVEAILSKDANRIKTSFFTLSGAQLKKGERCTQGLIRQLSNSEREWAIRVTLAATSMMPPDKLAARLEEIATWLRQHQTEKTEKK